MTAVHAVRLRPRAPYPLPRYSQNIPFIPNGTFAAIAAGMPTPTRSSSFARAISPDEQFALRAARAARDLRARLERIDPERLRERDLPALDDLERDGLARRAVAAHAAGWQAYCERLRDAARYGVPTRPRVIAAAMLAAHAALTTRAAAPLRGDLAAGLHALVALPAADRQFPLQLAVHGHAVTLGPLTGAYFDAYRRLCLPAGGRVAAALERCVTDPTVRLRLGKSLATLDPAALERELARVLAPVEPSTTPAAPGGDGQCVDEAPLLHAPTAVDLAFDWYRCDVEQETLGDQAFWVCTFAALVDVPQAVATIDQAIAADPSGATASTFTFAWQTTTWQGPTRASPRGQRIDVKATLGHTAIHHGFGPWCAVLTGIEDDNGEYAAVQEVVGQIGDYAEVVSDVAGTVAQIATIAGATYVATAAAAVEFGAEVVAISADVVEAVIEVVNYLDANDLLGRVHLRSPDDYVGIAPGTTALEPVVTADNPDNGARYAVQVNLAYAASAQAFHRTWRTQSYSSTQRRKHDWSLVDGLSGDDDLVFIFPEPVNWLAWTPPSYVIDGDNRHAEYVTTPRLVPVPYTLPLVNLTFAANQTARAKVHYGARYPHGITYEVTVVGSKLLYAR